MPRPILLFSAPWEDMPLAELAGKAGDWGYQGLEIACCGDHLEVQRALSEPDYCPTLLDLLSRNDLQVPVISNHRVGQAVCDRIDERHQAILPDYVWGDGDPEGVRQRAAEEMMATIRVAQKLGASVVCGFTGSPIWAGVTGYPRISPALAAAGLDRFVQQWLPILDVCQEVGVRFALEVHPGQVAFDFASTEQVLARLQGRDEFGLAFDPAHLHWQGIDPAEFLRQFGDRIYHVHIKDAVLHLNGRTGLLNGYLAPGDPGRGWEFRSPGHGGIDWEGVIRGLNRIGYEGPLAVDWSDSDMQRDYGAEDACRFVRRLDFDAAPRKASDPFRD